MVLIFPTIAYSNYRFPNIVDVWRDGKVIYGKFDEIKLSDWEIGECEVRDRKLKFVGKKAPVFLFDNKIFTLDTNRFHYFFYSSRENCQTSNQNNLYLALHYRFNGQVFSFGFNTDEGSIYLDILTNNSDRTNIVSWFEDSPEIDRE